MWNFHPNHTCRKACGMKVLADLVEMHMLTANKNKGYHREA